MKGVVFTEFIEMVENKYGFREANEMIESSHVQSRGVYSSIGSYDHHEMFKLVNALERITGQSGEVLLNEYGQYLISRFAEMYPDFFQGHNSPFEFLKSVDSHIHKEVMKLYPDAELPTFHSIIIDNNKMEMTYRSKRKMHEFAYGLILGCLDHFDSEGLIEMTEKNDGDVLFRITLT